MTEAAPKLAGMLVGGGIDPTGGDPRALYRPDRGGACPVAGGSADRRGEDLPHRRGLFSDPSARSMK